MRRDSGEGCTLNDPDLWALTGACKLPPEEDFEDFSYRLPFDLCMELADGNRKRAKILYYYHVFGRPYFRHIDM